MEERTCYARHTEPYPGLRLWYFPSLTDPLYGRSQGKPLAATVAFVHDDGGVNLCVLDIVGTPNNRLGVKLVQPNEDPPISGASWCCQPRQAVTSPGASPGPASPGQVP